MKFVILAIFLSTNVHAVEFGKYIKLMKEEMGRLLGEKKENVSEFPIPNIPKVKEDATSTKTYEKSGRIFMQGMSFKKLDPSAKRKYRIAFLSELYLVARGSEIQNEELSSGINVLEQGGTREGVYRSLVLSSNYRTLEAYQETPSEKLVIKTLSYAEKFLGLLYDKNQMANLNLWGIKRFIVEKALDVMDSFPADGEDLYRWYAHLSLDLSKEETMTWKNKTREKKDLRFHYLWAQKVPIQHVKSEVIIKLHRFLNSLN